VDGEVKTADLGNNAVRAGKKDGEVKAAKIATDASGDGLNWIYEFPFYHKG
jgi:hypothetical protein